MSLFSVALSGLNTAQTGLATTSHNIDNAATTGYNRQVVMQATAGAIPTANGFIGQGVTVTTVQRQYDNYLYTQLVNSRSSAASLNTQYNQISQINNLLGDSTSGISPALTDFFSSLNSAASTPSDPAVRQDLLGKASSLATQINTVYQQMADQRSGLNDQISTAVTQINSYLNRVNDLNQQIIIAQNRSGGQPPNDLMDQRDQAVSELSQLVGVKTIAQGNTLNITLNSGQTLLSGTNVYPLSAVTSSSDPQSTVVAYSLPSPSGGTVSVEIPDSQISGGTLGGLVAFRQQLNSIQNQLGQFAVGLAMTMNGQQEQGLDLNSQSGQDMFALASTALRDGVENTGSAVVTTAPQSGITYTITYDGTNFSVKGSDGSTVSPSSTPTTVPSADGGVAYDDTTHTLSFNGFEIDVSGFSASTSTATATTPDTWTLQPYSLSAPSITASSTNPDAATMAEVTEHTDYRITNTGTGTPPVYTVTRESDGAQVYSGTLDANNSLTFHGVTLTFNGTPNSGDSWELQPYGLSGVPAISNTRNSANDAAAGVSGATLMSSYVDANQLQASDYHITYDGSQYTVTRESDGKQVFSGVPTPVGTDTGEISFDGLSVTITGAAAKGDSWELQPTRNIAGNLKLALSDPSQIALADASGGTTNGNNGLAMAQLQTAKVMGNGSLNLNEAYSRLVNNVGVQTQQIDSSLTAQNNLITQQTAAQQSVSGVNLNEEYVNLTQYQEQYQASAKIINVATTIFDTILGLNT
jgi:flagellar hook-associated protein 1 FlgK